MSLLDTASLLLTPNAYKEGKLYSVIPSDGSGDFTFTRATTATRVNSAGLVELVPYNLFTYSEQFQNSDWIGGGNGKPTMTDNFALAPNGTLTASKMEAVSDGYQLRQNNAQENTQMNLSVWLRTNTGTKTIQLYLNNGSTASQNITVTTTWTRYEISGLVTTLVGSGRNGLNTLEALTSSNYILVWGFQLNEGSTALPYQKTETRLNIPRLDYSNGTCPSLLVEPQRTNLITYSSSFDNAAWFKLNATITANNTTSPSGIQDADAIVDDATNDVHITYLFVNKTTGNSWTCYMKKGTLDYGYISAVQSTTLFTTCIINLTNGAIHELQNGSSSTGTVTTEDVGNGWYRVKMQTNVLNAGCSFGTSDGSALSGATKQAIYTGTGSGTIYLWGAQSEDATYPTSYIPTTTASVTRNGDDITNTFLQSGGFLGSNTGAMFISGIPYNLLGGLVLNFVLTAATNTIESFLFDTSANRIRLRSFDSSSNQQSLISGTITGNYKLCVSWTSSSIKFFVNGSLIGTISQTTYPYTTIKQESTSFSNNIWGEVVFFPTNIADADAIALTTI